MSNATKIISGVLLVVILAGAGYFFYNQSNGAIMSASDLPGAGTATTTATGPGQDQTIQRLNRLEDIDINSNFLSASLFESFESFGIAIESQPAGRDNPFSPPQIQVPATIRNQLDFSSDFGSETSADFTTTTNTTSSTTSLDELPSTNSDATSSRSTAN